MANVMINDSGMKDPTAGKAISNVSNEEKKIDNAAKTVIKGIYLVLELAGFRLTNRIHMEHINSGRKYR